MVNRKVIKTYTELIQLPTFEERFRYLECFSNVGDSTFGFDRYLNQQFYRSVEWKHIRDFVIVRDRGCDLGIQDREIGGRIYVHHMNPITIDDIDKSSDFLLNPEYLICVSKETHDAIHFGDERYLDKKKFTERMPNDTAPWIKGG